MSFKVFIYNRITGIPQNLMRDIYRWETYFSVRTKAFKNLDRALQHISILKIDLGPPPPPL